ncbi:hypothetical protein HK103_004079 [Boothiomyces macroporosus]|uniref:Cilia- and flagella-associated protein 58 central coiled coil domain-containing protein n=1 Tax=Boothiomyces macroporosus TaxID=261099 RepID=A0AAD5UH93_9FUNG|nr:hypothetical protein HK103_004079 [Boothiomyces macroporosus]
MESEEEVTNQDFSGSEADSDQEHEEIIQENDKELENAEEEDVEDKEADSDEEEEEDISDTGDQQIAESTNGLNEILQAIEADNGSAATAVFDEIQNTLKQVASNSTEEVAALIQKLGLDYEKFNSLLVDSKRQTKSVAQIAAKLSQDLVDNHTKMKTVLKTVQSDRQMISSMRKELKKAWKVVEANTEKELKSKEVISGLKNELAALKYASGDAAATVAGPSPDSVNLGKNKLLSIQLEQEETIKKLLKSKQELEAELVNSANEIKSLKVDLDDSQVKIEQLHKEREYKDEEMLSLKDYLAAKKSEHDREIREREKTEKELRYSTDVNEKREAELKVKNEEIKGLKESLMKTELLLQNEKVRAEKLEHERDHLQSIQVRFQQDLDEQAVTNQNLLNKTHEQARKMKAWEEEIARLREINKTISKAKQQLMKKFKVIDETKTGIELERDTLRSVNSHLRHDVESTKKELETATKNVDVLTRERDISQKNFVKSTTASLKQYNILKLSEQTKRNLEQEIQAYKDEAQKMRKLIYTLERERDDHVNQVSMMNQEANAKDEEIKMKDVIIFDSKKKIAEFEKKLKEQQALYENVRTDRNVYSKNLLESQDEIMEMKRKLKIMNHQVEQLKEEIASRETVLVKEHFEHSKLEKEKEALLLQIAKLQQQHDESHQMIQNQQCEENKLRHIISEADLERIRQKKEYDCVVQERDILGTQLIRRNDELSLLYEKIKIQTSTLNKGEIQYRERLEDIRVLRLEIKKLRREKAILQTETQNVDSLRNEIFKLQRDILRERTRVKVLEAGSDPSTYELISKIQTLQKRLISKTEEVVEKELIIQQKEKLYADVKKVLQRQPGPEIMEELQVVRAAVKSKVRESKALASELNMYHSQVNEYKYEIEKLNREMQELKSKYFQLRKKRQNEKRIQVSTIKEPDLYPMFDDRGTPFGMHNDRANTGKSIKSNLVSGPRFSGGGFNMSTGHHVIQKPKTPESDLLDTKRISNPPVPDHEISLDDRPIVDIPISEAVSNTDDVRKSIHEPPKEVVEVPAVESEPVQIVEETDAPVAPTVIEVTSKSQIDVAAPTLYTESGGSTGPIQAAPVSGLGSRADLANPTDAEN